MSSAWTQRIASECNISLGQLESYYDDAITDAKYNRGKFENDQDYWRYVRGQVLHRIANEGCKNMMTKIGPEHQSRALKGLLVHILSEYETGRQGAQISDKGTTGFGFSGYY